MAIDTLDARPCVVDRKGLCGRELERIARAVGGGPAHAGAAIVRSTEALLQAAGAVLLRPTHRPDLLAATCATAGDPHTREERWELGPEAPRLFDRTSHTADGWRAPWSGLRMRLRALNLRSWAAVPLGLEGWTRPLGVLVVGGCADGRPCADMRRLPDLALSATAALMAADGQFAREDDGPCGREHLRTVGNLAFGLSHSLGNIFGAILANLHFLQDGASPQDADALVRRIERSTHRGLELMRSLRDFTSVYAPTGMGGVDLSEIARDVAGLIVPLCGHWPVWRTLQIETDLARSAPAWGDPRGIRECIVNLAFNAMQAVGRDGRVLIRTICDGRFSEVRVIDDGPGMIDEVLRVAAEPFFTTHPSLHEGLGLTIARGVAVGHRGGLTFHRAPLRGTEVALRIPQDPPADPGPEMLIGPGLPGAGHGKEQAR